MSADAEVVAFPIGEPPSSEGGFQPEDGRLHITRLHNAIRAWHHKPDIEVVDVTVATYLSVHENDRPLNVLVVAPPSFSKSEQAIGFKGQPNVRLLSKITPQTLVSGLKGQGDKVSLLKRLPNPCMLLFKDFTTIISMPSRPRNEILGQLREIADGQFDGAYGTGQDVSVVSNIAMLACCTQVIDTFSPFMQMLGERFLYVRPHIAAREMDDFREQAAHRALMNGGKESAKKDSIQKATADYLSAIRGSGQRAADLLIPDNCRNRIVALADYISLARTAPVRHWRTREIESLTEPEGTPRLAGQFGLLARCLALARQHPMVDDADMRTVVRVGKDTLTILKRRLFEALGESWQPTAAIAAKMRLSPSATQRHLEDAFSVPGGLVDMRHDEDSKSQWRLSDKAVGLIAGIEGSGL